MEEKCVRCERSGNETRLLDGVYDNQRVKICGICAQIEGIPVIRRPSTEQLKAAEKPYTVNERLRRMAGFKVEKKQIAKPETHEEFNKERVRRIRENVKPLNLVDNYNWYIQRMRRARNMTRKQLAESIAESEEAIKMVEQGALPSDAEELIKKLEQFFMIKLVKPEDGYVDESIVNLLRQRATKPAQLSWQQQPQAQRTIKPEARHEIVIDKKVIPSLRIGDLKALERAKEAVGGASEREKMTATELVKDIIKSESDMGIDDYDWRGRTFEERRKISEDNKNKGTKESIEESEIESEDSIFGNDLEIEEK